MLSPSVENLVAQLTRLPGIGSRTAQRLAFHLLQTQKEEALALAGAIEEVKERVRFCNECGNCDTYQTIVKFRKGAEKNVYTYECENEICDPNVTRTYLEVPTHLDNSTRRAEELPYYTSDAPPEPPE